MNEALKILEEMVTIQLAQNEDISRLAKVEIELAYGYATKSASSVFPGPETKLLSKKLDQLEKERNGLKAEFEKNQQVLEALKAKLTSLITLP